MPGGGTPRAASSRLQYCCVTLKLPQKAVENGQIVYCETYADKLAGLTYNTTTPYALPFIDMRDGPWVTVMPEVEVRGAAHDFWQIGITQMT